MNSCIPNPSRRQFLALSSIAVLGLLPGVAYARMIREMRGSVTINDAPALPETLIQSGDTIRTGADSRLVFVIGGDVYQVGENAHLKLTLEPDNGALTLVSGSLLAAFAQGGKKLRTPTATIGIRGTALYLSIEAERAYFCTCYGHTLIQPDGHDGQEVSAEHHLAYYLGQGEAPIQPAGMLGHTDDEVKALDALAGRTPPQSFVAPGK